MNIAIATQYTHMIEIRDHLYIKLVEEIFIIVVNLQNPFMDNHSETFAIDLCSWRMPK